jgi:[acyl-carrier-protein] S-malonyltransferase
MIQAFVFPGQGSQFPGMGKEHYDGNAFARRFFEQANEILGFRISDIMFNGTEEELKQTNVTQPAIFLHSVIAYKMIDGANPHMVAGHSLGEFSALVVSGSMTFEDALKLVSIRASAMHKACEINPSTMAAILGLPEEVAERICAEIISETGEIVVPANYNCPGQLVISGTNKGIDMIINSIIECIDYIYDEETLYYAKDTPKEELVEFIENLQQNDLTKIQNFFDTMPKIIKKIEFKCAKCGYNEDIKVEGIQSFFG